MLVAINKEDKQIHANQIIKRHEEEYRCPACRKRVIYRSGPRTIPHFAHQTKGNCQAATESETADHLSGKNNLYRWLRSCQLDVELEKYIAIIKQRPDIYVKRKNQYYAIEYQCSSIHEELFLKRTKGYLDADVVPIWIFHSHFIKRNGVYLWRLNSLLKSALRKSSSPFLLFHNPKQANSILAFVNIIPVSIEQCFGQMVLLSEGMDLESILSPPKQEIPYLNDWFKKRTLQLMNEIRFKGLQSKLIKELYQVGISPFKIPEFVGVPLLSGCMYGMPATVWQGLIYIDLLNCFNLHGRISEAWIRSRFLERIKKKDIILNQCPLMSQDIFTALKEYLRFLEKIDYLEKIDVNHYIIREDFILDDHFEEIIKLRLFDFYEGN
ncbi:hypothetical protein F7984_04945 [Pradoshia sp. D12]|uniref:competence protein CoiA n=1 Tax=Bacillaceae TaxID=186817 RepID=UPI00080ADD77|nr:MULTISPECIES: competence protein CoiA family protein [Bacillaceae]OCA89962.1 hypothetical protein A8L44_03265 [Bacillus sp. FJAT-27986]QFK70634.1 hypothetical protein F7984_04945 [Pradoshia sp. D12]TPF72429.1 hypothetical protein FHY44_01340 [Bacillus sp. D12]